MFAILIKIFNTKRKNEMKLKMILLLTGLLSTYSYATCSKTEVMKLIDKGFSKTEINSICDIQAQSTTSSKPKSKWMNPSRKACTKNGGKLKSGGICVADWHSAKRICSAAGGRLPNINELKSVLTGCGGEINDYDYNRNDSSYQACYKQKGFSSSDYYWSSSVLVSYRKGAWYVSFKVGNADDRSKAVESYVRCVRGRQ